MKSKYQILERIKQLEQENKEDPWITPLKWVLDERIGINLQCVSCGYQWEYKGKSPYWATCPNCQRKTKIEDSYTTRE